jgi:hypothetical protein
LSGFSWFQSNPEVLVLGRFPALFGLIESKIFYTNYTTCSTNPVIWLSRGRGNRDQALEKESEYMYFSITFFIREFLNNLLDLSILSLFVISSGISTEV